MQTDIFDRMIRSQNKWYEKHAENDDYGTVTSEKTSKTGRSQVLAAGAKVHFFTVVGPSRRAPKGVPGEREYLAECICGTRSWEKYRDLYYGHAYSCGCRRRHKHPNVKLEGEKFGEAVVAGWDEEEGKWRAVCETCRAVMQAQGMKELRAIGGESCEAHGRRAL